MSDRNFYSDDTSTTSSSKKQARNPYLNNDFYNPNLYNPSLNDPAANPMWGEVSTASNYDVYGGLYSTAGIDQATSQMNYYPADPYSPYSNQFQPNTFQPPSSTVHQTQHGMSSSSSASAAAAAAAAATANQFRSPMPTFDPNVINNQFVAAGAQMFQNSVNAYSQDLMNKGLSWFDNSLKYYFAVDTGYVLKKLLLLFFPFAQKDWLPKYNSNEPVAPRDDINVPDLYIPCMAFVTYILAAGSIFGLKNAFSPEKLGIQASYALFWLILEVAICLMILYLMNIRNTLGFFHLISYCSYKFVFMIVILCSYLLIESAYYWLLIYSSLSLGYFLIRSLNTTIQTNPNAIAAHGTTKVGLYLILGLAFVQPLIMYWMTSRVVFHKAVAKI